MDGKGIKVEVSKDRMSVLVSADAPDLAEELMLAEIETRLKSMSIKQSLEKEAVLRKLKAAKNAEGRINNLVIAEGIPVVEPVPEHIKWEKNFFASSKWAVVNEAIDRVDYRERSVSGIVRNGELLGKIVPPKAGINGMDVLGNPIVAAKPEQNRYRPGKNVRLDEKTGCIYAAMDGMVRLTKNSIEIDEVCETENVGLDSGNIRFPGAVLVRGDVEDLATIEAGGSVEVGGVVWAAKIESEGDVTIKRGLSGRDKGKVTAKGTVSAAYMMNADIEAGEGVIASKEIVQSRIRCRGRVQVNNGRIVGGETIALGGIVIAEAGSDGNISTLLAAGEDYSLSGTVQAKNADLAKLQQAHKKIHDSIEPMMERLRLLSPKQREAVTELMARAGEMEENIETLKKEIEEITGESRKRSVNEIRILKALHPGVTLRILGLVRHITKFRKGPLTVKIDTENNILTL